MADRITLNFDANTQRAEQGTDRIASGLDDVEDKLDDVGQAGEDAGTAAADGLDEAGRAAGESTDIVGSLGDSLLGVAGIAGGVGGAVSSAIGGAFDFVKGKIDEQIEAAEAIREALVGAYKDAASEGQVFLSQAAIIAAATEIYFDSAKIASATKEAQTIGVDVQTYVKAQAGDYAALKTVIEAAKQAEADRIAEGSDGSKSGTAAALQEVQAIERIVRENENLLGVHEANQEAAQATIDLTAQLGQEERDQIAKTASADQARYEGLASNIADLNSKKVVVPATIQTPDVSGALRRIQRDIDHRPDLVVKVGLKTFGVTEP